MIQEFRTALVFKSGPLFLSEMRSFIENASRQRFGRVNFFEYVYQGMQGICFWTYIEFQYDDTYSSLYIVSQGEHTILILEYYRTNWCIWRDCSPKVTITETVLTRRVFSFFVRWIHLMPKTLCYSLVRNYIIENIGFSVITTKSENKKFFVCFSVEHYSLYFLFLLCY